MLDTCSTKNFCKCLFTYQANQQRGDAFRHLEAQFGKTQCFLINFNAYLLKTLKILRWLLSSFKNAYHAFQSSYSAFKSVNICQHFIQCFMRLSIRVLVTYLNQAHMQVLECSMLFPALLLTPILATYLRVSLRKWTFQLIRIFTKSFLAILYQLLYKAVFPVSSKATLSNYLLPKCFLLVAQKFLATYGGSQLHKIFKFNVENMIIIIII